MWVGGRCEAKGRRVAVDEGEVVVEGCRLRLGSTLFGSDVLTNCLPCHTGESWEEKKETKGGGAGICGGVLRTVGRAERKETREDS